MSTNVVSEIREAFANLNPGQRGQLSTLPAAHPAWVYATPSGWGVALKVKGSLNVSEKFTGARLFSIATSDGHELRLESHGRQRRQEFAVVCAQFIEPGEAGEERSRVITDPAEWWRRWRELLGNAMRDRKPYSVLGELLAFERLLAIGEQPIWLGPSRNSHDIETSSANYEVKSTISKYSSTFRAAGQFQLGASLGKHLFIVYQRFEPSVSGHSINSVAQKLAALGHDVDTVEQGLAELGYEIGASDRQIYYQLLQSTKYAVDENFPKIIPSSFVGGTLPPGIVSVEYEVDLAGLSGTSFA
jgi:Putative  PD-(D/E)XK family member, (DUF4420)